MFCRQPACLVSTCHREIGFVIASAVCHRVVNLSSRGTKRSRLSRADKQLKRDCRAALAMTRSERLLRRLVFACHREERGDLSFQCEPKQKERLPRCARLCLSSRGTKRSRVSNASKQQKARLLSRLVFACHREERGDLGFRGGQTAKREIAALRSSLLVIARNVAISGFGAGKQLKARLPRCACLCLSSRGAKRSRGSGLTDS